MSVTTSTGTVVKVVPPTNTFKWPVVTLHNPANGPGVEPLEVGRIIDGTYQTSPFAALLSAHGMSPETLRAIADVVEEWNA